MAPLPTLPPAPTLPYGSSTASGIKKGTNVFRPGATRTAFTPFVAEGAGPYGPMVGVRAGQQQVGLTFPALYDGTDDEVGKILAGVDDTGDGTPLSPAFRRSLKDTLLAAGFLSKSDYVPSAEFGYADYSAMRQFLQNANYLGGYNWREALGVVTDQIASKGTGGASTYTQYSISRPEEAELIVDAALNNFLGRGATKEEKANLSKALRKYEQETPTVTTTTRGTGGTVGTTTTGATTEGRQQAILGGFSQAQQREMNGVVNTKLGNLFTDLLRNA